MLFAMLVVPVTVTKADALKEFVLSQLDGRGIVNNMDLAKRTIVVDDSIYDLARTVTVFDATANKPSSLRSINVNDEIGFKSRALREPTKPYDQLITKIWILKRN